MKKNYLLLVLALLCISQAFSANVTVNTSRVCTQTYTTIQDIVIAESGAVGDFGTAAATNGNYLFLVAPTGFEFNPSAGVNANFAGGGNASGATVLFKTASIIAITYNCDNNAPAKSDQLTITGIAVKATSVSNTVGNITMGTGSFAIGSGPFVGNTLASVQSAITAIGFSPASPKCNNDATFALGGTHTLATSVTLNTQSYTGSTGISGTNFNPSAAAVGANNMTYTVTTNTPSCTFTATASVDVNAAPIVTLTVTETGGATNNDGTVCDGDNILFEGFGANTYKFYKSPSTLLSSASSYSTSSLTNGDVIFVEGTATNSCKDNSPNRTITVNAIPAAPTFNPSNATFGDADPGFWLDTLGTAAEEANRASGDPSYFTGNGVVFQSNRYFFYPNVAGNGTHTIVYHYVDPVTRCESTTSKAIVVGTGVSAGNIQSLNSQYCINAATDNIYIDFCNDCFFWCTFYDQMEYSPDGGGTWIPMVPTSTVANGSCGFFGSSSSFRYNYTINPATMGGAGIKLFRYSYTNSLFGFTYYSSYQSTVINALPNIAITNSFNSVSCSDQTATQLTYTANGASGTAVFSSTLAGFVTFSTPNYFVNWNVGGTTPTAIARPLTLTFTDNVTTCVNTYNTFVAVAQKPAAPTFYPGYPYTYCNTNYTAGVVNSSIGYTVQWIKDLPGNSPTYSDNYYPQYGYSYFPRGVISADEVYYAKQYIYPTCISNASAQYDLIVKPPVNINIGQYANVCSNQTISLNKMQKGGPAVTQTWSTLTGAPGSFDNNTLASPTYTLSASDIARGYVSFRVLTSDPDGVQGCPSDFADTTVYINKLPTIGATSPLSTYCSNNLITIDGSIDNSLGLPLTWYKGSLGGTQTGINTPTAISSYFTPSAIEKQGGTITFYVESQDIDGAGPCAKVNANVAITINPEAVVNAGTTTTVCGGTNISLSGTCTLFGGANLAATWSKGAYSQFVPATTNPKTATYTPSLAENNGSSLLFTLTSADPDGVGPCTAIGSSVIHTINQAPTIFAGADATYCSSVTPTLTATLSGSSSGVTWSRIGVGGTIITPTTLSTTYTYSVSEKSGTTITFIATSNDPDGAGPCVAATDQVNITVNPEALVDAGTTVYTCGSAGVPLSGTCTLFGGGNLAATWSKGVWNQAVAAATNPKNVTYTPTVGEASGGIFTYFLTSNDPDGIGPCPAISDFVQHVIKQAPVVNAGADATYCSNTIPVLTASLSGGSASSVVWTRIGVGGTITTIDNLTANYAAINSEKAGTTITFIATTDDPDGLGATGPCVPVTDQVAITINPEAVVDAGAPIYTCGNANVPLSGTCTLFGGANLGATWSKGVWSQAILPTTNPKNFNYAPTVIESNGGTYTYTLTSDDPDGAGPCPIVSKSVSHIINQGPFVNAGTDVTLCSSTDPVLVASLAGGSASSVVWTRIGAGGVITAIDNVKATYSYLVAEKSGTAITFVATTNDPDGMGPTGPCLPVSDNVIVTVNPEAVVDPGTTVYTCGSANVPLSGTCTLFGGANLGATWTNTGSYSQYIAAATNPKNASYTPTAGEALGGSFTYYLTSDDPDNAGPCLPQVASVVHYINKAPFVSAGSVVPVVGIDSTWYCSNTTPLLTSSFLGSSATSLTWTKSSGSGTIQSITAPSTSYIVNPGDYSAGIALPITFTATTNDPDGTGPTGPCLPATDITTIILNPHLTVSPGGDITVCANQTINLNGTVNIGGIARTTPLVNYWATYDGFGGFTPVGPSNFTGTYNPSGTLTTSGLTVTPGTGELGNGGVLNAYLVSKDPDGTGLKGPCKADSASLKITINPLPVTHFDPSTKLEFCLNDDPYTLKGNLGSNANPTNPKANFSGNGFGTFVVPNGNAFDFVPDKTQRVPVNNVNGGTYTLTYTFTDVNGCVNHEDLPVKVYPYPKVSYTISTRCQYDTITFSETSTISSAVWPSSKTRTDWYIDFATVNNAVTPNISTLNTPTTQYAFQNYGNHSIGIETFTNSGGSIDCSIRKDTVLNFAPYPSTNYSWSRPCSVDSVHFVSLSTIPAGYTFGRNWQMNGAGSYKAATNNLSANPIYKFNNIQIYNVTLTDTTQGYNCISKRTKEVFVVPTYSVTPSDPYDSSFANSNLKWAPSVQNDTTKYSWEYGTPLAKQVISTPNNVWITKRSGSYNIGELSYLNSPCFNFSTLDKPMITLNLWSETRNLAGAMLEASVGNTNTWTTIGQIGDGINWYNTPGVVGLIGVSGSNPIAQGFSGELGKFDISKIGLSQYANQTNLIRFRLTFGSYRDTAALNRRDGIALDSVWIGNRSKVVLMEHFTNASSALCREANDTINSIQSQRLGDVVNIQYHTSFPGMDLMNGYNPADPSSRVLYYGIPGVPRTVVDGLTVYDEYGLTPNALKLSTIDNKALENAKFSLDISSKKTGLNIDVKTQLVAKELVTEDVVLNVAVLEKLIPQSQVGGNEPAGYQWVLKKMLPDAAGSYISKTWAIGDTVKMTFNWNFTNTDFFDTSKVDIVAFVQSANTKEVFQTSRVGSTGNTTVPIITPVVSQDSEDNLMVYPVPADNEINVLFGNDLIADTDYMLSDELGKTVEKGVISRGVRMLSFNSKKLAAGMYTLSISRLDGSKINKKVIVIH